MFNNIKFLDHKVLIFLMVMVIACESDTEPTPRDEDVSPVQDDSNESVEENTDDYSISGRVSGDQTINFNNWSNGTYTHSRMSSDFGNASNYSAAEKDRSYVISDRLKITLLKDKLSGAGGVIVDVDISNSDEYILKYDIKFHSEFEWSKGGKLPGLAGGAAYTGGGNASNGDGWSFRVMWRQSSTANNGVPWLQPYVYYVDQPGTYGQNFGARFDIQRNQWYTVEIRAKMNTGSNYDGLIQMKVDNTLVYQDTSFRWATQASGREIDLFLWRFFRGGSTNEWEASTDSYIYIDNVTFNKL